MDHNYDIMIGINGEIFSDKLQIIHYRMEHFSRIFGFRVRPCQSSNYDLQINICANCDVENRKY